MIRHIHSFCRSELLIDKKLLRYTDSVGKGWFGWIIKGTYKGQPVVVQVGRTFFPRNFSN